jgi:single-strand DNA-binding protein
MARDVNTVLLTGRAGGDPEERDIGSDTTLVTLNFAVTNWNGEEEDTMWVTLNFWGKKANVTDYIKKGMKLTITGNLSIRRVENDDGDVKYYTAINVNDVVLPDRGDADGGSSGKGRGRKSDDADEKPAKKSGAKKRGGKKKLPF